MKKLATIALAASAVIALAGCTNPLDSLAQAAPATSASASTSTTVAPRPTLATSSPSAATKTQLPKVVDRALFGNVIYQEGLMVGVSSPKPYQPPKYYAGARAGAEATHFVVVISNSFKEPIPADRLRGALLVEGQEVARIFGEGLQTSSAWVLPGDQVVSHWAFDVSPKAKMRMTLTYDGEYIGAFDTA